MNEKTLGSKISAIIACVVSVIFTFSIFMFFMDALKWDSEIFIELDAATPSFFDLMFGLEGSKYLVWPKVGGAIAIFVTQIVLIIGAISCLVIKFLKKEKISYLLLAALGILAIISGILSLCLNSFMAKCTFIEGQYPIGKVVVTFEGLTKLNYGAIVYSVVMLISGVISFTPYVLKYCLKK